MSSLVKDFKDNGSVSLIYTSEYLETESSTNGVVCDISIRSIHS